MQDDEETGNLVNEKANRNKRSRNAESHSLSERVKIFNRFERMKNLYMYLLIN